MKLQYQAPSNDHTRILKPSDFAYKADLSHLPDQAVVWNKFNEFTATVDDEFGQVVLANHPTEFVHLNDAIVGDAQIVPELVQESAGIADTPSGLNHVDDDPEDE